MSDWSFEGPESPPVMCDVVGPSLVHEGSPRHPWTRSLLRYHYAPAALALVMAFMGLLGLKELDESVDVLWRPLLAITAVMVTADAVNRLGVLERVASVVFPSASGSSRRLFILVFFLSAATAAVLNNDAAVLLLVPLVVGLVRRLYAEHPGMQAPFALAVIMAGGIAPLAVSNPMNMIVVEYAGVHFNAYALRMVPISLASSLVALSVLLWLFRRDLALTPDVPPPPQRAAWTAREVQGLALLLAVFGAYPLVAYVGGPVHLVAVIGALTSVVLCACHRVAGAWTVVRHGVAWEILVFLAGVSIVAVGLQDVSITRELASFYDRTGLAGIALVSSIGSAVLNNHPMSIVNMLALAEGPRADLEPVLAALIGGNLGPRLLPWGSLAGLLWFASLRRLGVEVPVGKFMVTGAALTALTLPVSVLLLVALP